MKSNKGITLIVLVITIIVLLVLAGVAIASLSGNNGITQKAQEAKTKSDESLVNEETTISGYETKIETHTNGGTGSATNTNGNTGSETTYWQSEEFNLTLTSNTISVSFIGHSESQDWTIIRQGNIIYDEETEQINAEIKEDGKLYLYWDFDPENAEETSVFTQVN